MSEDRDNTVNLEEYRALRDQAQRTGLTVRQYVARAELYGITREELIRTAHNPESTLRDNRGA